ncbi:MAG: hypothetical protein PUB34_03730 [Clostridia bacterium]|nr:hypothetical protein [Clostridia bacterium]
MKSTKKIALSAVFCSLSVVLMFFGSATNVLDITCAGFASLIILLANIEIGTSYSLLIYFVVGTLSFILLPDKFCAVCYIGFIGWYPIAKNYIERIKSNIAAWTVKIILFNISLALIISASVFILSDNEFKTPWIIIAGVVISNVAFVLFDIALTRLISLYYFKYRNRFKKFFG